MPEPYVHSQAPTLLNVIRIIGIVVTVWTTVFKSFINAIYARAIPNPTTENSAFHWHEFTNADADPDAVSDPHPGSHDNGIIKDDQLF
jgi:hypothetical protein